MTENGTSLCNPVFPVPFSFPKEDHNHFWLIITSQTSQCGITTLICQAIRTSSISDFSMLSKVQQTWLDGSFFLRLLWEKHINRKPVLGLTISSCAFTPFVQLKNEAKEVVKAEATCLTRSKEMKKAPLPYCCSFATRLPLTHSITNR